MLRSLGIYSVLCFIVAVLFLLEQSSIDDTDFYLACAAVIGFSLLAALSKTIKQKRMNKLMPPADEKNEEF